MTTPDELAAGLPAAVQICDETGGGADYQAIAARIGADPEIVLLKLLPAIAKYFRRPCRVMMESSWSGSRPPRRAGSSARKRAMPDESPYDPDRTVPEDLDFSDPDVAMAYLDHPTTKKLGDDIGRLFRSMPAADQQRRLSEYVSELEEMRAQAADFQNLDPDAPGRLFLQQLLDAIDKNIEAATLRMLELD